MSPEDAEEYTQALGQVVAGGWRHVALGQRLGVPAALGISTTDWVELRLGGYVRMSVSERREAVKELTAPVEDGGAGLSTRQAAAVLGVSRETVRKEATDNILSDEMPTDDEAAVSTDNILSDGFEESEPDGPDPFPDRAPVSSVHFSSETPEWYTPRHIIDRVLGVFGVIDLDPCADPTRRVPALHHFTAADDGLAHPWTGRVYMNPPYGDEIAKWGRKLADEFEAGRVTEAVALVPGRIDTAWFSEVMQHAAMWCSVRGRLKFSESDNSAPFPSVAAYLGARPDAFVTAFDGLGSFWKQAC